VTLLSIILTRWANSLSKNTLFDLFQGAVVLSAWYGGLGPGILTAALSILALDYFFMEPFYTFRIHFADLFRLVVFGAVALLTSSLSDRLKRAKQDLERSSENLEIRVQERTDDLSRLNAHLQDEVHQRMQAEKAILEISNREQRRLSEDVHDGLCQLIAGVKLLSEGVKEKLAAQGASEANDLELIESRLAEALSQADHISQGLYPVELTSDGLMAALEELADKISKIYSVTCQFESHHPVLFHDAVVTTHLYRIAQEAVINAIKGGKAKHVRIRLNANGLRGTLSILDNGTGFLPPEPSGRKGMGLQMMQYRANVINALLAHRSGSQGGTVVRCSFPMTHSPSFSEPS
jgi:signal transduction histidine kinase